MKKFFKRPFYRLFRKISRKFGYDLVNLRNLKTGLDPYLDMKKFIGCKNPLIFDVGANYGQTIDNFEFVFNNYKINSFEPSPYVFKGLKNKVASKKDVQAWNYGLGSRTGFLTLNENSHRSMTSFLSIGKDGWGTIESQVQVPVITIDDFCKENNINHIDILKIDTQGFELEILKGAKSMLEENNIGLLYFEVTFIDMYEELPSLGELYDFVKNMNFELISIYPIKYKNHKAGWTDVLFMHKAYKPLNDNLHSQEI